MEEKNNKEITVDNTKIKKCHLSKLQKAGIICLVVGILLIAIGYFGYQYYSSYNDSVDENEETTTSVVVSTNDDGTESYVYYSVE